MARIQPAVSNLQEVLNAEFEDRRRAGRKRQSLAFKQGLIRRLRGKLRHQTNERQKLETRFRREDRLGGRIAHLWFVRAGLAAPTLPVRTVADLCRDFPAEECKNISHYKVGRVRDAFCEIVKRLNRKSIAEDMSSSTDKP